VRLFGLPFPGHTNFPEINLRYYVRRTINNELRRGVVFAREIVPRRAVAIIANRLYNENYITRPIRSNAQIAGPDLAPNDTLAYSWKTPAPRLSKGPELASTEPVEVVEGRFVSNAAQWDHFAARAAAPLALPAPNSLEEFIVEHYWGYTQGRDGRTHEYNVAHIPWRVAPADKVTWNCDVAANYGNSPLVEFIAQPPLHALIAEGSRIELFRGHVC
jgi:uncharacterized protein YqjF (DUF2071 family)